MICAPKADRPTGIRLRRPGVPALCLSLAAAGAFAGGVHIDQLGPLLMPNDSGTQISETAYYADFRTDGVLRMLYRAPKSHCSAIKVRALVDDRPAAASDRVDPGGDSGVLDLGPQTSGVHTLAVFAQGMPGGCNTGQLRSWGGSIVVWTSGAAAGLTAPGLPALGPVVFEIERTGPGQDNNLRGQFIGADGWIHDYGTTRRRVLLRRPEPDDGLYGADWLLAKYGHVLRIAGEVRSGEIAHYRELAHALAARQAPGSDAASSGPGIVTTHSAFVFDPERGAYRRIELARSARLLWDERPPSAPTGGPPPSDAPPEAQEIVAWLTQLGANASAAPVLK